MAVCDPSGTGRTLGALRSPPMKMAVFVAGRVANKKRDTLERMSPEIFGNEIPDQVGDDVIAGLTGNLLLIKRSSNVNSASNCTTYHRVVTDAEESHHLNVCWN